MSSFDSSNKELMVWITSLLRLMGIFKFYSGTPSYGQPTNDSYYRVTVGR